MTSLTKERALLAFMSAMGVIATASSSQAQAINCNDASLQNPIYVAGSSAVQPLAAALGKALWPNVTIVYVNQGSCAGVGDVVVNTVISGTPLYYPGTVDDAGLPAPTNCNLPAGQVADIGVSDVFPTSCAEGATWDPATVGDFWGPNQVMTFAAPQRATLVTSISAEAAYFVMGQAATGKTIEPWTDATQLSIRNSGSGTQTMLGKAIHLDAALWKGPNAGSSSAVQSFLSVANASSSHPEAVLGIISTGETDTSRAFLKVLAFQDFGQKCAYWPDTSLTTFDKKNVRTGLYPIFGPLHLLAKVSGRDMPPSNPAVATIIGYFTGLVMPPAGNTQLIDLEIAAHTIPQCAMTVRRTSEMGPLSAFKPTDPCGCYFESKFTAPAAPPGCTTCTTDAQCGDSGTTICSYGYCEAK